MMVWNVFLNNITKADRILRYYITDFGTIKQLYKNKCFLFADA